MAWKGNIMYCCVGMEGLINDVECDGSSVTVRPFEQRVIFRLQFKSIADIDDTKKINAIYKQPDRLI